MPLTIYPATAPKVRVLELVQHAAQALDGQYEARVDEAVEELSGGVDGLLLLFGEGLCIEGPGGVGVGWGGAVVGMFAEGICCCFLGEASGRAG